MTQPALTAIFRDPRVYQIVTLASLLGFGLYARAFDIQIAQIIVIMIAACATQWVGSFLIASKPDFKSPLITALSLCLLLRADMIWPLAAAAFIAVGSKFLFRTNGKHIFNPANIGIVALVCLTDGAWTTPGQWGSAIWFAAALAGVGMFVTYRAARVDVPLIFLGVFTLLLFGRALWLGDPLSIPLLRLQNGALILFAFFMISDPKTSPDGAIARAFFASGIATLAYFLIWHFYVIDGLFIALTIMCVLRPLLEWADPAPQYRWGDPVRAPPILKFLSRRRASARTAQVPAE